MSWWGADKRQQRHLPTVSFRALWTIANTTFRATDIRQQSRFARPGQSPTLVFAPLNGVGTLVDTLFLITYYCICYKTPCKNEVLHCKILLYITYYCICYKKYSNAPISSLLPDCIDCCHSKCRSLTSSDLAKVGSACKP